MASPLPAGRALLAALAWLAWGALAASARELPYGPLTGPEETVATRDGHVLIHFTREGGDAVDDTFVTWGRESLELAWAEWIDRLRKQRVDLHLFAARLEAARQSPESVDQEQVQI